MNKQKQPPEFVKEIFKQNSVRFISTNYYAWPQTFSSASGPHGGVSSQVYAEFTVEAWVGDGGGAVYVCEDCYVFDAHSDRRFQSMVRVLNWRKQNEKF